MGGVAERRQQTCPGVLEEELLKNIQKENLKNEQKTENRSRVFKRTKDICTMEKIKIALLGIGRIGKFTLIRSNTIFPEAEVVAVSAARRTKEEFTKEYGNIFFSNKAEDAIKYPGVDAVLICTSTSSHAERA